MGSSLNKILVPYIHESKENITWLQQKWASTSPISGWFELQSMWIKRQC